MKGSLAEVGDDFSLDAIKVSEPSLALVETDFDESQWSEPATREFGTDSLDAYVRKLTPGQFLKKINKKEKVLQ